LPPLPLHPARLLINPRYQPAGNSSNEDAWDEITSWPDYAPTPLVALPGLARKLDVGGIFYKDEGGRFGLGSFKALGGAYAVLRMLQRTIAAQTGETPSATQLRAKSHLEITDSITVTTATDGNHGRSVAWGASQFGCRAVIYIPADCSPAREAALADLNAEVVRIDGGYDDAVARCAGDAAENKRTVISDTSWDGYRDIPREVTQGYTVMAEEALRQMPGGAPPRGGTPLRGGTPPSHIFIQGGVGALPAAICGHFSGLPMKPRVIVVEPAGAACLYASAEAGRASTAPGPVYSVMAGLNCGSASPIAWEILDRNAFAFMTIPDESAGDCMKLLADGNLGGRPVIAGESAVAGLAALISAANVARTPLGLGPDSQILLFGTEGATDPDIYAKMVGSQQINRE
jgi:diaminopropionate ammonia-lyase